jgi:hypothetical protein
MADLPPEPPPEPARHISAEDARGGEIILRKRWERGLFLAGLIGALLLGLAVCFSNWD